MSLDAYSLHTLPDVGRQYQALRKSAGKTQLEVAKSVGMRQEALSRFESGSGNDFSLVKLLRLLQALNMELDFKSATRRPTLDDLLQECKSNANTGPDAR
jgi:HTH-type transcriptional regulator/antitoxin HipB